MTSVQCLERVSANWQWSIDPGEEFMLIYEYDKYLSGADKPDVAARLEAFDASNVEFNPMFGAQIAFTAETEDRAQCISSEIYNVLCEAREWDEQGRPEDFVPTPPEEDDA